MSNYCIVRLLGHLHRIWEFETVEGAEKWIADNHTALTTLYDNLEFKIEQPDYLKVGDKCYISEEGDDVIYTIVDIFLSRWSTFFLLDNGRRVLKESCVKVEN